MSHAPNFAVKAPPVLALWHDRNLKCTLALQTPWLCLPLPSPPPLPPPVCTALPAHSTPLSSSLLSVEAFEIRLSKMLLFELMNHFSPGVVGWGLEGWGLRGGGWGFGGPNKYRVKRASTTTNPFPPSFIQCSLTPPHPPPIPPRHAPPPNSPPPPSIDERLARSCTFNLRLKRKMRAGVRNTLMNMEKIE